MKKTTREFGTCEECQGFESTSTCGFKCWVCKGTGRVLKKETIEESDGMKEFIEKKLGWKWVEGKKKCKRCKFVVEETEYCTDCMRKINETGYKEFKEYLSNLKYDD